MQGRLIVFVDTTKYIGLDKITTTEDVLEALKWCKERYKNYTAIHYLDGSIEAEAKGGFLQADLTVKFTPIK